MKGQGSEIRNDVELRRRKLRAAAVWLVAPPHQKALVRAEAIHISDFTQHLGLPLAQNVPLRSEELCFFFPCLYAFPRSSQLRVRPCLFGPYQRTV